MLDITVDTRGVDALLGALPTRLVTGTARAINRTVVQTRAFMVSAMAADTGLPPLIIDPALTVKRAAPGRLEGEVAATSRQAAKLIPILQLQARQIGRGPNRSGGVTFRFGGVTKTIPDAFIATMRRTGHRGVFTRRGKSRLPIIEEKGPALRTVFGMSSEKGRAFAQADLATNVAQELETVARDV